MAILVHRRRRRRFPLRGGVDLAGKKILDVTCGPRSIWFNKNHPAAVYCDKRACEYARAFGKEQSVRRITVKPDILCSFTALPFPDATFSLVVFDPPHLVGAGDMWMRKFYGFLAGDWRADLQQGFRECMRVLKPDGILVFKWAETSIPTPEIIEILGQRPLFGHRSGKKSGTNWLCYMKLEGRAEK